MGPRSRVGSAVCLFFALLCVVLSTGRAAHAAVQLEATKTVSGIFREGETVTYTVTIDNVGTTSQGDNAGPEFADILPSPYVTLVSGVATHGTVDIPLGGSSVTWNGELPALVGTVTITLQALLQGGTSGAMISNQGRVLFDADGDETNESTGYTDDPGTPAVDDPTTFLVAAGAVITATKTDSGNRNPLGSVTYTIVLTNHGGDQADNPGDELTDVLPPALTLISATATSGTAVADLPTNTVTWNGAIPEAGSVTITIDAAIENGTFGTTISNQATLSYDSNGDLTNNASGGSDDPDTPGTLGDPTSFVVGAAAIQQIPTLSELGFAALALLLAGAAIFHLRNQAG